MKGITPIIAIVLLLAITIAIVGFSFVYFQRIVGGGLQKTYNQSQQFSTAGFAIESVSTTGNVKVFIRAIGGTIKENELVVYVNGTVPRSCDLYDLDNKDIDSLGDGETGYCNLTDKSCSYVKVTGPNGLSSQENC